MRAKPVASESFHHEKPRLRNGRDRLAFFRLAVHLVLAAALLGIALSARAAKHSGTGTLTQMVTPGCAEGVAD